MGFIQSNHDQIGLAFSIVGLVLIVPSVFLFKQYNRFLDHCQMVFLFWIALAPTYETFGGHLDESWAKFIPNFLKFCSQGELVCQLGFALSWTICLLGVIFLLFVIVSFEKCRKPDLRFEPVYSFFKGFFKWTYLPLAYYSVLYLILDLKLGTRINLIPSIVLTAWVVIFPILQLIYYKAIQEEKDNIWIKWFQFLGYIRQLLIVLIFLLGQLVEKETTIVKYFVYGPLVLYAFLYFWKGVYINKIAERVLFVLEETIILTIFSLYLFAPIHLAENELDFLGLTIILLLNVIYITMRLVNWLVYGKLHEQDTKINPQIENQKIKRDSTFEVLDVSNDFRTNKFNKFDDSDDLLGSRDSLNRSIKKGNQRRRR